MLNTKWAVAAFVAALFLAGACPRAEANTTPGAPSNDTPCYPDGGVPTLGFYEGGSCWQFGLGLREGNDTTGSGCGSTTVCTSNQVNYWLNVAQQTSTRAASKAHTDCGTNQDPHLPFLCIYEIYWNPNIAHSNDADPVIGGNPPTGGGPPIAGNNACGSLPSALNSASDQTIIMAMFNYEYPNEEGAYYHLASTSSVYSHRAYFQVLGDNCGPVSLNIQQTVMSGLLPQAVMVDNTTNVVVGSQLAVGGANPENISVTAVGTLTITAVFTKGHTNPTAVTGAASNNGTWTADFYINQSDANYQAFANQIFQGTCGVTGPVGNGQHYPVMQPCVSGMADARLWESDRADNSMSNETNTNGQVPNNTGGGVSTLFEASTDQQFLVNRNSLYDQAQRLSTYPITVPYFENNGVSIGTRNEFITPNLDDAFASQNTFAGDCELCSVGFSNQPDVEVWSGAMNAIRQIFSEQGGRGRVRVDDYDSGGGTMQERMAHTGMMLLFAVGIAPQQTFGHEGWDQNLAEPPIGLYADSLITVASAPLHSIALPVNTNSDTQGCDGTSANHGVNDLVVTDASGTSVTGGVGPDYAGKTVCVLGQEYPIVYYPSSWCTTVSGKCPNAGSNRDQEVNDLARLPGNGVLGVVMNETNHSVTFPCGAGHYMTQTYNQSYQPAQVGQQIGFNITQIVTGSMMPQTVTVNNTTNVYIGTQIAVGGANPENVFVTNFVSNASVTGVFKNAHANPTAVTGALADVLDLLDTDQTQPFLTFSNVFAVTSFTCNTTVIPAGQTFLLGHS